MAAVLFEGEEASGAPDPELAAAFGRHRQLRQLVIDRPHDPRLQSPFQEQIGHEGPAVRGPQAEAGVLSQGHPAVEIGAETQPLARPLPLAVEFHREEGGILHRDRDLLERGEKPVTAVGGPTQGGGEQAHELGPADRRPLVVPGAPPVDAHPDVPAAGPRPGREGGQLGLGIPDALRHLSGPRFRSISSANVTVLRYVWLKRAAIQWWCEQVKRVQEQSGLDDTSDDVLGEVERAIEDLARLRSEIGRIIYGQEQVVEETLTAILAGGHVLLVGVPGLAKTRLAETLGTVLGLVQKRVQFTPDLMPADILGSEVLEETASGSRHFRFLPGPVFAQLLMADEINRASPRTQAALLQAMQEKRVTVAGQDHPLPEPFHVLATQNPIEQEGTYPLPEAQLDRFIMQVEVGYPSREAERRMMVVTTGIEQPEPAPVLDATRLQELQRLVRRIPVGDRVVEAILELVRAGRPENRVLEGIEEQVAWGPGPRASQALLLTARVRALLDGRLAPSIEDVLALAPPVLRHRMAVTFAARAEGIGVDQVITRLCRHVA